MTEAEPTSAMPRRRVQRVGLPAGPVLAAVAWLLLPDSFTAAGGETVPFVSAGRATAAIAVWMATWWLTEAIHVSATALLPLVLLPLLGATSMKAAAAPYAHELIFLFLGGFLIALTMEKWNLHRRLALLALRVVGERPANIVGGFMVVSALLSMWVSNTATAVMMLPVALSVIDRVGGPMDSRASSFAAGSPMRNFGVCLLLGIAYGASIGGIGTPIGTPPNLFLLSYVKDAFGRDIGFARWMALALPLVAVFLPIVWLLLTRVLYPIRLPSISGGADLVRRALADLGPMSNGERVTLAVFLGASTLWVTRPLLMKLQVGGAWPLAGLSDAGIAMLAAMVLFVAPVRAGGGDGPRVFALDWETAMRAPWGILLLFGGGLSLAAAIRVNGVGELLGAQVAFLAGIPSLLVIGGVVTLIVFLTELTSNTATTATFVPILAGLAPGLGLEPLPLIVAAAISASCAFMLPVATPPNAIVFGSGLISIPDMSRAGIWLNIVGIVLVTGFAYALVTPLLSSS